MADLNANFHGMPVKYWYVGGAIVTAGGLIMLRRYRAAKALAAGQPATTSSVNLPAGTTGPQSGSPYYGPLGGSSPTGPIIGYGPDGTPIYGVIKDPPKIPDWAQQLIDAIKNLPTKTADPTPVPSNTSTPNTSVPAAPVVPSGTAPVIPAHWTVDPSGQGGNVVSGVDSGGHNWLYGGSFLQAKQLVDAGQQAPVSNIDQPMAANGTPVSWGGQGGWDDPRYSWK